jgi:hypothetical protein
MAIQMIEIEGVVDRIELVDGQVCMRIRLDTAKAPLAMYRDFCIAVGEGVPALGEKVTVRITRGRAA